MSNLPKEFNMTNQPWECPRCGHINAPFNPSCFCKPDDEPIELQSSKLSEHVMDAANYLKNPELNKIIDRQIKLGDIINTEIIKHYKPSPERCMICNGYHGKGVSRMTLKVE